MTTTAAAPTAVDRRAVSGVAAVFVAAASSQTGAACAAQAFPAIGPVGVVAVRQFVTAVLLVPLSRPRLRRLTWRQWWPCLLLGAIFATMNLSLYCAIERIGLGLAVTLEFLGPLAVALAGSRGARDLVLALAAGSGVYVLVLPGPSTDLLGIGLALVAACCWASYILTNRVAGSRLPGLEAAAVASLTSSTLYLPVLIWLATDGSRHTGALLLAATAGILSSAIPYAADLTALRYVSARFFGVFMSIQPIMAALAGLVLLHQTLAVHQWLGMGVIVMANVAVAGAARGRRTPG